jgi:hypothetical protein
MLRKSLIALLMGAVCTGSAIAQDAPSEKSATRSGGIASWFKSRTGNAGSNASKDMSATGKPSKRGSLTSRLTANSRRNDAAPSLNNGIERAVVADAERQAIPARQTSASPQDSAEFVQEQPTPPSPVAIQQAPVLPNTSTLSGPQYFSATPAEMSQPIPVQPGQNWQVYQAPQPVGMTTVAPMSAVGGPMAPVAPQYLGSSPMYVQGAGGMIPNTGAALYPAPRPGIPYQIGGTSIPNQAFHPHEMLYPHRYKALYPPYYYKVNGGWMVTPFGVWSKEDWYLQGTQVDVKYKSHISPFSHFKPPYHR